MSTKRKSLSKFGQPTVKQSVKVLGTVALDESKTVVSSGVDIFRTNSDNLEDGTINTPSDLSSVENDSDEASTDEKIILETDTAMEDTNKVTEDSILENTESPVDPSFGELVRASISEPINVAGTFDTVNSFAKTNTATSNQPPLGASLGSILTQALRTNDTALLETCFHTSDINTIRATIQRLDSHLAVKLLQKLAERLHKRPGIAGKLMVWVQWTLVAHGGYLAAQRGLVKSLAELTKVIDERSRGLQSVLLLKGKLDMLEAQIEMRKSIQSNRRRIDEGENDDDSVIYVEDQEFNEQELKENLKNSVDKNLGEALGDKNEIADKMPTINGMIAESEEEDQYSSDDDSLVDDEAIDSNSDLTDEENEIQYEEDSVDDEEDSDAAPPPKLARTKGDISKKK